MISSPFLLNAKREGLPKKIYSDYSKDEYIVEYSTVDTVEKTGDGDTEFILKKKVVVTSKTPRTEYINSYRDDVGILNILRKVALSGDATMYNQTHRIGYGASGEVDSLGRDLEPVVDVSDYQLDHVEALEKVKATKKNFKDGLPQDLTNGLSFEALANLSDDKIDAYLADVKQKALAVRQEKKGDE